MVEMKRYGKFAWEILKNKGVEDLSDSAKW